ncbi:MAG: DUF7694 domain-containing protein [Telluria sp.]
MFRVPEQYRVRTGLMGTDERAGNNGLFLVKMRGNQVLAVVASDGEGWEHVSVSRRDRCPSWEEMCHVKALFWSDDACVMQLHPPKADWISNHQFCLHLWRPVGVEIPRPPALMVGMQELGQLK